MSRTIYVGNVPYSTTEEELRDVCSMAGLVRNVTFCIDERTNRFRGFAFVEYADEHSASCALRNLSEYDLDGRCLRVRMANEDTRRRRRQQESVAENTRCHRHRRESNGDAGNTSSYRVNKSPLFMPSPENSERASPSVLIDVFGNDSRDFSSATHYDQYYHQQAPVANQQQTHVLPPSVLYFQQPALTLPPPQTFLNMTGQELRDLSTMISQVMRDNPAQPVTSQPAVYCPQSTTTPTPTMYAHPHAQYTGSSDGVGATHMVHSPYARQY